ncbi:MAG TPA: glycosyltransferase family 39 protein, partial [Gemmatimonadaceae bacterium]|nr:glycosyltransferase family 39 protein [Gemmatimonadaceae bacterium]
MTVGARWSHAVVIVTVAAAIRLVFAALVPPLPDEAYYWTWSRHMSLGFFDHPPGIAMLIRAGGMLLSPFGRSATPIGVRFGAVIAGWIAAVATAAIARRVLDDEAAVRAAIIMSVLPLAAAGLILATPDAPVLAAAAVGLYCVVRAIEPEPSGGQARRTIQFAALHRVSSVGWWIAAGVVLGLAFSSKYTSIFLPVGVVAAIVIRPSLRARLREPGPYAACVLATLVFAPVLWWNAHHGWVSFVYQVRHGLAAPHGSVLRAAWRHEGDFFGGQAALASPIVFVLLGIAVARGLSRRASNIRFVLAVVSATSFAFFVYSALRQRVEPNWPALAYVPAIALLAATPLSPRGERWRRGGLWLAVAMSAAIYVQALIPILPIAGPKDPIGRAFGWRELTAAADSSALAASRASRTTTWLAADRYQEASVMALYDPLHPA